MYSIRGGCSSDSSSSDGTSGDDSGNTTVASASITKVTISGEDRISAAGTTELTANPTFSGTIDTSKVTYSWNITSGNSYASLSSTSKASTILTAKNTTESEQTVNVLVIVTYGSIEKTASKTITVAANESKKSSGTESGGSEQKEENTESGGSEQKEENDTYCAVVYSSKFGAVPTTLSVKKDSELANSSLPSISCSPYKFLGWFYSVDDDKNGTGTQAAAGDKISDGITLYAKWQTATISFESKYGAASSITKYTGETISESEIPALTETGYTFSGWFNGSALLEPGFTVSQDLTFTAKWTVNKYTVTFNSNGGAGDDTTQTFSFGTSSALNANTFTRTGYSFAGWATTSDSESATYADGATYTTPASNTTLYAVWKANTYTITFNSNNSSGSTATQSVTFGTTATLDSNPFTYSGYKFTSWNTSADGSGSSYSDESEYSVVKAENVTLYAQWAEADRYIITYKNTKGAENSSPTSYRETVGATVSDLSAAGYIFGGWYDSADSSGNGTGNKVAGWGANEKSGDITLYAKWSPRDDTAYKVEHYQENANDTGYTLRDTENLTGTTDASTSATAKSYNNFTAQTVTQSTISADGTTVVKIYYTRNTVTMTFSLAGGTINDESSVSLRGKYGSSFTLGTPVKTGYTFTSWLPTLPATMESGTYTATYSENTDTKYTVYHYQQNANDDGYTLKDTVNLIGTTAGQTLAEAKSYEHFTAQSFSQKEIAADGSTQITIKYDRETVTFTLDLDGGTLDGETGAITKTGKYGQSITVNNPTKTGYSFAGWNSDGGTISSTYDENTTYKAQWTANSIGITASAPTYSDSDLGLSVNTTSSTTEITFTAKKVFSSYEWYVDGAKQDSTSNTFTMSIGDYNAGSYTVMLVVDKKYSAIVEVAVSK